jgi:hypothetical protein
LSVGPQATFGFVVLRRRRKAGADVFDDCRPGAVLEARDESRVVEEVFDELVGA